MQDARWVKLFLWACDSMCASCPQQLPGTHDAPRMASADSRHCGRGSLRVSTAGSQLVRARQEQQPEL